jgi:hypothetical protein
MSDMADLSPLFGSGFSVCPAYTFMMGEAAGSETFEGIVEWAYSTLSQRIKDLPDFPGIQVTDEPPEGYLGPGLGELSCLDCMSVYPGPNADSIEYRTLLI